MQIEFSKHPASMRSQHTTSFRKPSDPVVHGIFDKATGSWQYVAADPTSSRAVIIDPVLNFDPVTARLWTESADRILAIVNENGYKVDMILETHVHADHITAASYLQHTLGRKEGIKIPICIGSRIKAIQKLFGERYNIPPKEYKSVFDKEWDDDEVFKIGILTAQAIHLPGHTPDHMGYKIGGVYYPSDCV
jgi:glyoxylase-like metal-dependent hydrolase (beta-lactamase superfamily II)